MNQYLDIIKSVLENGIERTNRTNLSDSFIPSATMVHDLRDGFPAITTKQLFYKQSIGEILGFLRGYDNAQDFADLGCKFWFSDANENKTWLQSPYRNGENDLGKVYGSTWRSRQVYKEVALDSAQERHVQNNGYSCLTPNYVGESYDHLIYSKEVDQLRDVLDLIINEPNNRRIMLHGWFPELFDEMALPPCHVMYRFVPDEKNKVLHMSMFQRSCDLLLGVPMNTFGSALMLELIAKACGYTAGVFTHNMADVHLYENQIRAAKIMLDRDPIELPSLTIDREISDFSTDGALAWLETTIPDDVVLHNYKYHKALPKIDMAQEK